jgi:hypothetical protein
MTERYLRVYMWDDQALVMSGVVDEVECTVFYYWLEDIGNYSSVFGNTLQREMSRVYEFPPLGTPIASDLVPLQSKGLLTSGMAELVVEMADFWCSLLSKAW